MKKTIFICLMLPFMAIKPVPAQVKKAGVKLKEAAAAVKIPVLNKLDPFSKTPEDLVQFLNDEFKKLSLNLSEIDEETNHLYDGTKQLEGIASTSKILTFTNSITAIISADANDKVTALRVEFTSADTIPQKAIHNMLGFATWPIVIKSDINNTFKNGNTVAYAGTTYVYDEQGEITDGYYAVGVEKITPYSYAPKSPVAFDAQSLNVYGSADDAGYGIVKLFEGLGIGLVYKKEETPMVIDNKLSTYLRSYFFKNSVSADIETSPFRRLRYISIGAKDPITFLKIKKALNIGGWKMSSSDIETKTEVYQKNNVTCTVSGKIKSIYFEMVPDPSDIMARIQESDPPSLDELMEIYHSGTKEQVIAKISGRFVNEFYLTDYPKPMTFAPNEPVNRGHFLIRTDDGKVPGKASFNFGLALPDMVVALYLRSGDGDYLKRLCDEFKNGKYNEKYECLLNTDVKGNVISLAVYDRELHQKRKVLRGEN